MDKRFPPERPLVIALLSGVLIVAGCTSARVTSGAADAAAPVGAPAGGGPEVSSDPFVLPPVPPSALPCGGCLPGQSCHDGKCVNDCRSDRAVPCAAPNLCDYISGTCVPPAASCVLTGVSVACGRGEFPPRCGPGSRCEGGRECLPDAGCGRVVCDASNFCRGADCPQVGGGGVQQVSVDAIADAPAGAAGAVKVGVTVKADGLCGLSVTFELHRDLELYVSAHNDRGIWRVPLAGAPSRYVTETEPIGGVTADRTGTLYYALQDQGIIRRVAAGGNGMAMPATFATLPAKTLLLARMTFGPDGRLYAVAGQQVFQFGPDGSISQTWVLADITFFLTGIVFDRQGGLLVAQKWPTVWRLAPGGTAFTRLASGWDAIPGGTADPWNEGMGLGLDGLIYVGVFPTDTMAGVVYRIEGTRPRRILGLAEMRRGVPDTQFAGVHGVAFGNDGTLYFVNQNTYGPTGEALGQVLGLRPSGKIEIIAGGLNFDWGRGFDGDIVVSEETTQSVSAPVDAMGRAQGALDAPATPGTYGVRILVTDPRTGAISAARATVVVR